MKAVVSDLTAVTRARLMTKECGGRLRSDGQSYVRRGQHTNEGEEAQAEPDT